VPPIFEYSHEDGGTVIGGYVYRGNEIPELVGRYVFGDLFETELRSLTVRNGEAKMNGLGVTMENLVSFGEDHDGELYALSLSGPVYRLVAN
jgi:hypothetical protein